MGTTVEKLAYLKETKSQIKQALETPYNVMRDYPALIKKYIDNQPTNTVSDGNCTNALDMPLVTLSVDGNSEQQTYEGYNLLPNQTTNITKGGITLKKNNDGSITLNGTSTTGFDFNIATNISFKAGTYTNSINTIKKRYVFFV